MRMAKRPRTTTSKVRRNAIKHGYRSGLEHTISQQLEKAGVPVIYEQEKLAFLWPSRPSTYTPDWKLLTKDGSYFYVESKGRFLTQERQKHLLLREQHPDINIRFVFSSNQKLYKGSKTTYSMWCEKHGFQYAFKTIPDAWLEE